MRHPVPNLINSDVLLEWFDVGRPGTGHDDTLLQKSVLQQSGYGGGGAEDCLCNGVGILSDQYLTGMVSRIVAVCSPITHSFQQR